MAFSTGDTFQFFTIGFPREQRRYLKTFLTSRFADRRVTDWHERPLPASRGTNHAERTVPKPIAYGILSAMLLVGLGLIFGDPLRGLLGAVHNWFAAQP